MVRLCRMEHYRRLLKFSFISLQSSQKISSVAKRNNATLKHAISYWYSLYDINEIYSSEINILCNKEEKRRSILNNNNNNNQMAERIEISACWTKSFIACCKNKVSHWKEMYIQQTIYIYIYILMLYIYHL